MTSRPSPVAEVLADMVAEYVACRRAVAESSGKVRAYYEQEAAFLRVWGSKLADALVVATPEWELLRQFTDWPPREPDTGRRVHAGSHRAGRAAV